MASDRVMGSFMEQSLQGLAIDPNQNGCTWSCCVKADPNQLFRPGARGIPAGQS